MRILVIIASLLILIGFDVWSKDYIENRFAYDLCVRTNTSSVPSEMLGWYFPEIECNRDDTVSIYQRRLHETGISVISDWIMIKLSYNTGVAFSLPIRGAPLQVLTIMLITWIVYQYVREEYSKRSKFLDVWYALVLAGALSHAYERIAVGHVVDFIAVKYFAILNFADIFISIGAACIICYYVFYEKRNPR